MLPAPYGLTIAHVRTSVVRCAKPPPTGWRSYEWLVMGGRQSGGIATIQGCGGELYRFGEFVGVLVDVEFENVWDLADPVVVDGHEYPRLAGINTLNLTYVPAIWYLVG